MRMWVLSVFLSCRQVVSVISQLEGSAGYSTMWKMKWVPGHSNSLPQHMHLSADELQPFGLDWLMDMMPLSDSYSARHRHDPPVEMEDVEDLHTPRPIPFAQYTWT